MEFEHGIDLPRTKTDQKPRWQKFVSSRDGGICQRPHRAFTGNDAGRAALGGLKSNHWEPHMATERDFFITGLRNAHAMEIQARELMERQIDRTQDYPEIRSRLQQHLVETTAQIERIEGILKSMGESWSTMKDTALSVMGNLSAMMHAASSDEIIKTCSPTTCSRTLKLERTNR